MKWLQLSDLHIKECADWEIMKNSYIKILSKEKIDFIIVTGDLHNFNEDYTETKIFLDMILLAMKLDKNSLFIIPGNHDLKDSKSKKAYVSYIDKEINKDGECYKEYLEELMNSFEEYQTFYKEYFNDAEFKLENVKMHTWNDKINIIGLNSALISDGNDTHKQIIDTFCLSQLKIDNNLPSIAIGHHDISYLYDEHQNVLKRVFTDLNVSAYLCGDLHKGSVDNITNHSSSNKTIPCIVCGRSSVDNTDAYSDNSFIIYESLNDNELTSKVTVFLYKWNKTKKSFLRSSDFDNDDGNFNFPLYPYGKLSNADNVLTKNKVSCEIADYDNIIRLEGYVLIGPRGNNGIKYVWKKNKKIIESLAFNQRLNGIELSEGDMNTSAYTSSLSHGCILQADDSQCIFCETGKNVFRGYLTAEDIALQNIFMAEYDSSCPSYPSVRKHLREFAYMGQGEPGHAYHLIRKSILLTDYAMDAIKQNISRYIISTCGICGFIPLLIDDIKNHVFKNKISLHFSLNAIGNDRDILMPINRTYHYQEFIKECEAFYESTKEKIAVSIIIFNNLVNDENGLVFNYSLTREKLGQILELLDPLKFRIDLRDFNSNKLIQLKDVSNEFATDLLKEVESKGFEAKLFSCFGENERTACGMLASTIDGISKPGKTTINHYTRAIELLDEARKNVRG